MRAETLAESSDWEAAAAELKRLQAEWKTIGPVRKNKSEVIWHRFRAACDRFFERYKQRHILDLNVRLAAREALIAEAVARQRAACAGRRRDAAGEREQARVAGGQRCARSRPRGSGDADACRTADADRRSIAGYREADAAPARAETSARARSRRGAERRAADRPRRGGAQPAHALGERARAAP